MTVLAFMGSLDRAGVAQSVVVEAGGRAALQRRVYAQFKFGAGL